MHENAAARMKFRAELSVVLIAILIAESITVIVMLLLPRSDSTAELCAYALFGLVTTVLAGKWLRVDIARAYANAVSHGYLVLDGQPPRVVAIRADCPCRWFVVLHVRLHPHLIDEH